MVLPRLPNKFGPTAAAAQCGDNLHASSADDDEGSGETNATTTTAKQAGPTTTTTRMRNIVTNKRLPTVSKIRHKQGHRGVARARTVILPGSSDFWMSSVNISYRGPKV